MTHAFLRLVKQITAANALTAAAEKPTALGCVLVAKTAEVTSNAEATRSIMPPVADLVDVVFIKVSSCLTKKAEPPPIRGVACNRSGNGGWLRRLVR